MIFSNLKVSKVFIILAKIKLAINWVGKYCRRYRRLNCMILLYAKYLHMANLRGDSQSWKLDMAFWIVKPSYRRRPPIWILQVQTVTVEFNYESSIRIKANYSIKIHQLLSTLTWPICIRFAMILIRIIKIKISRRRKNSLNIYKR